MQHGHTGHAGAEPVSGDILTWSRMGCDSWPGALSWHALNEYRRLDLDNGAISVLELFDGWIRIKALNFVPQVGNRWLETNIYLEKDARSGPSPCVSRY